MSPSQTCSDDFTDDAVLDRLRSQDNEEDYDGRKENSGSNSDDDSDSDDDCEICYMDAEERKERGDEEPDVM